MENKKYILGIIVIIFLCLFVSFKSFSQGSLGIRFSDCNVFYEKTIQIKKHRFNTVASLGLGYKWFLHEFGYGYNDDIPTGFSHGFFPSYSLEVNKYLYYFNDGNYHNNGIKLSFVHYKTFSNYFNNNSSSGTHWSHLFLNIGFQKVFKEYFFCGVESGIIHQQLGWTGYKSFIPTTKLRVGIMFYRRDKKGGLDD